MTVYIVNLSTAHTLLPVDHTIDAFARLYHHYANTACHLSFLSCLEPRSNRLRVQFQHSYHQASIIDPYKRGEITTEVFLEHLLRIFPFMAAPEFEPTPEDKALIDANRATLHTTRGLDPARALTNREYAQALLEHAWNSLVEFNPADVCKIQHLLDSCKGDDQIIFISNTNYLNLHKIFHQMRTHFPQIQLPEESTSKDGSLMERGLTKGMSLVASCYSGSFKAQAHHGTPALVDRVVESLKATTGGDMAQLRLISQYEPDRARARNHQIDQVYAPSDFYPAPQETFKTKKATK